MREEAPDRKRKKKKRRCSDDIAGSLGCDSTITDAAVIAIIIGTEI